MGAFQNKNRVPSVREGSPAGFALGQGDYGSEDMIFPTSSTFLAEGVAPGRTTLALHPRVPGTSVQRIVLNGKDVKGADFTTAAGQVITDVMIVVGPGS